ncbi:MAG: DUF2855 family protein [Halioglobus sp.]
MSQPIARTMIASVRDDITQTQVLHDELPALEPDEIRLQVDRVGLSANNLFYAQMGDAPFLKFFSVYPLLDDEHKHLANLPAWGVATIIESANAAFAVGEQYRGFLHIADVVQMKAKRTDIGFRAYGALRDKLNPAYNDFKRIDNTPQSPLLVAENSSSNNPNSVADFALVASPGAVSGFILSELLKNNAFYGATSVVLTSASSKLSLATAMELQESVARKDIQNITAYTSSKNRDFVASTKLFSTVLTMDEPLPTTDQQQYVFIDVAGDADVFKKNKSAIKKGLAVGGTHGDAEASTFTAFSPSGFLKMFIDMMAPDFLKRWASRALRPKLEMFFAPTVVQELVSAYGQAEFDRKADTALANFATTAINNDWVNVERAETEADIQAAYREVMSGAVSPATAVVLSLTNI